MDTQDKKQFAILLLQEKAARLGRLPKRSDFSSGEVCLIKQKLGPWPRALEAAGLKEPPPVSSAEKSRLKRERRRKQMKQAASVKQTENAVSQNTKEEQR